MGLGAKPVGCGANAPFNKVVPEHHADLLSIGEVFRQRERIGDAALALLVGVINMSKAEVLSIAEEAQKVARVAPARHDQNIPDIRIHQCLDRIINHRPVING